MVLPITPIAPAYRPKKYFVGLRHDESYLIDKETGERLSFDTVRETWEAKENLERGILV